MILKILKNSYQLIKKLIFNQQNNDNPYLVNYKGKDRYDKVWFITVDHNKEMQLWAMSYKKLIRNCGYYKPYRNITILKKITNWKS